MTVADGSSALHQPTPIVAELASAYLAEKHFSSEATAVGYGRVLRDFADKVGWSLRAADLTPGHVMWWLEQMAGNQKTRDRRQSIVRGWCAWMVQRGYIDRSPAPPDGRARGGRRWSSVTVSVEVPPVPMSALPRPRLTLVASPPSTPFRDHLIAQGLAPRTVSNYVQVAGDAEAWFTGQGYNLAAATAAEVAEYLLTKPRTYSSRNRLRTALGHYWASHEVDDPPLAAVRVPPKPRMVCHALEEHEGAVLANAARNRGDAKGLATALGLYLALRREEIASLRWSAFGAGGWVTIVGKGEVSRTIPVHPELAQLLAAHPRKGVWVFPGRSQGHISPMTVWGWVLEVAREANVGHVPPHRLRHTALAAVHDATGDLRTTQQFAGHQRIETTVGYTRTTARQLAALVEALEY